MWRRCPLANIGIPAGGDFWSLDVDEPDGPESLAALKREHGELPPSWQQFTGGGGFQLWFRPVPELRGSVGKLGPGLDVRAQGNYCVAPPSTHLSGRQYAWNVDRHPLEHPLVEAPTWLVELALQASSPSERPLPRPPQEWTRRISGACPEGQRNSTLTSLAGVLFAPGPRSLDVVLALLQQWNLAHCQPPLPAGEVEKTVRSVERIERKRRQEEHHGG
jgi:hypothetical protein